MIIIVVIYTVYTGCTGYLVPVSWISGHFLISGSGSGQNGTKNRMSQLDSDWSFLAVSLPIKSVTGSYYCALSATAP